MNTSIAKNAEPSSILIVDDEPANLELLMALFKKRGYRSRSITNGAQACAAARAFRPDLVLLDVKMPEVSGYEVCAQFKSDASLREVPIIFLSALHGPGDRLKGFQEGGVDFLSKPFLVDEVEVRVRTHIELYRQRRQLTERQQQLKELETLRDSLTHMIVHDMRSPLYVIQAALDFREGLLDAEDPAHERVAKIARDSLKRLNAMTAQILDISRLEAGEMPLHSHLGDLVQTARAAVESALCVADPKPCSIREFGPVRAIYDPDVIHRVIYNLLGNAQKFTPSGGEIRVGVEVRNGMACVSVADNGRGIPPEHQSRIFDKFAQVNGKAGHFGTGLGLAFCKLAIKAHGGQVGVESSVGKGSTFWFSLPLARRRESARVI